jgi:YbbR domain-containing protein
MWSKIQTYLFVTLITILAWLYAEGENLKVETYSPEIVFVATPAGSLLIEPSRPPRRVDVTFKGPNSQLQEVMRNQPIKVPLQAGDDPDRTIDLAQLLAENNEIMRMGLTVQRVDPSTVKVRVEEMRTVTMPIDVVPGSDYLATRPTITPPEATVTLPASEADQIAQGTKLIARLALNNPSINQQTVIEGVELSLPEGIDPAHATIDPPAVSITVTITQKTRQSQPLTIPVRLVAPISELARYDVRLDSDDPLLRNVILEGPNAIIDEIDQRKRDIWAELRLSASDLENAAAKPNDPFVAQVTIPTPEGVRVVQGLAPLKYRVTREEPATNGSSLDRPPITP